MRCVRHVEHPITPLALRPAGVHSSGPSPQQSPTTRICTPSSAPGGPLRPAAKRHDAAFSARGVMPAVLFGATSERRPCQGGGSHGGGRIAPGRSPAEMAYSDQNPAASATDRGTAAILTRDDPHRGSRRIVSPRRSGRRGRLGVSGNARHAQRRSPLQGKFDR